VFVAVPVVINGSLLCYFLVSESRKDKAFDE